MIRGTQRSPAGGVPAIVPVTIHSLGLDPTSGQPVVILKEDEGLRVLPIWIGQSEATAILIALEGLETPRPMTHDLMLGALLATGFQVERVEITRLEEGTFFATVILRGESATLAVDSRPSDGMALAVRCGCPVVVAEDVMNAAGVVPDDEAEHEVERFRDFLDRVTPEDFGHS